jgi:hypothetical protein
MTPQTLLRELIIFLDSSPAAALCRRYDAEPRDALGELFLRLSHRAGKPIQKPSVWVRANGCGLLRNYLRAEHSRLRQPREV